MNNLYSQLAHRSECVVAEPITPTIDCQLSTNGALPQRAHPTDAGADLRSAESFVLQPGDEKMADTGVAVKIPQGFGGFVFNRSSQGKKGIIVLNSVGVVDSDYRGTVKVLLKNLSNAPYEVVQGDRIAQLVVMPVVLCEFRDAWNDTERGTGGFGSTGKQ